MLRRPVLRPLLLLLPLLLRARNSRVLCSASRRRQLARQCRLLRHRVSVRRQRRRPEWPRKVSVHRPAVLTLARRQVPRLPLRKASVRHPDSRTAPPLQRLPRMHRLPRMRRLQPQRRLRARPVSTPSAAQWSRMQARAASIRTLSRIHTVRHPARRLPLIRTVPRQAGTTAHRALRPVAMGSLKAVSVHRTNLRNSTADRRPVAAVTVLHRASSPHSAHRPAAVTANRKEASAVPLHLTELPAALARRKIRTARPAPWCPWAAAVSAARSARFATR